jgi:hypothetical protein
MIRAARRAGRWLALAAAPTFAGMAVLTAVGGGQDTIFCSPVQASPLEGMSLMYLLMGVVHAPPWLKLAAAGRRSSRLRRISSHYRGFIGRGGREAL